MVSLIKMLTIEKLDNHQFSSDTRMKLYHIVMDINNNIDNFDKYKSYLDDVECDFILSIIGEKLKMKLIGELQND